MMLSIESDIEAISAVKNPSTSKPGTNSPVKSNKIAFITKVKSPRVNIFIGKRKNKITGLINVFISPIMIEAKIAEPIPSTSTPGIIQLTRIKEKVNKINLIIKLNIITPKM